MAPLLPPNAVAFKTRFEMAPIKVRNGAGPCYLLGLPNIALSLGNAQWSLPTRAGGLNRASPGLRYNPSSSCLLLLSGGQCTLHCSLQVLPSPIV